MVSLSKQRSAGDLLSWTPFIHTQMLAFQHGNPLLAFHSWTPFIYTHGCCKMSCNSNGCCI